MLGHIALTGSQAERVTSSAIPLPVVESVFFLEKKILTSFRLDTPFFVFVTKMIEDVEGD